MAKVVVADADRATLEFLKPRLARFGHEVVTADDAYAAANSAESHGAALVVVANQIASGGSAKTLEWLRAKSLTQKTPVIVLSSIFEPSADVEEGPLVRILEKPIDEAKFAELVNEFLGPTGPTRVAAPVEEEDDEAPPPSKKPLPPPIDMGAPADDDLPPGDTISLDL